MLSHSKAAQQKRCRGGSIMSDEYEVEDALEADETTEDADLGDGANGLEHQL